MAGILVPESISSNKEPHAALRFESEIDVSLESAGRSSRCRSFPINRRNGY